MKRCPTCGSTYTDDTLRFCLQDGAVLKSVDDEADASSTDSEATLVTVPPARVKELPATEIFDPRATVAQTPSPDRLAPPPAAPNANEQRAYAPAPPNRSRSRTPVIILSILVIILLGALGGVAALLIMRNREQRLVNQNSQPNVNRSPTRPTPSPTLSPTPTPAPTISPAEAAAVRDQATKTLQGWADSTNDRDINAHMSYYADTLETYYLTTNVSSARVRADRERAFDAYSDIEVELTNILVAPDPTNAERATAVFDKTWTFEGDEKYSHGSVQQKLWLQKINGRWLITGEKDLQVYFKE
ncbi:MAG: hypothetical protein WBP93_01395 [Pyrinomonadaceae bacterium]